MSTSSKTIRVSLRSGLPTALAAACLLGAAARADDRPVHHIVLFQFKEGTTPAEIQTVAREFSRLPGRIPGIRGFQWGTNNSPEGLSDGLTHAFIVTFDDLAAREIYFPHPAHLEFRDLALPKIEKVFVNDFLIDEPAPAAEPGRTHHLVFFKYKESASQAQIDEVAKAFAGLESKIPGLLYFQTGEDATPEQFQRGFKHCFWLTFVNERARNDYLPHPEHKAFVEIVGPVLEKPLVVDFTVRPSSRSLFVTGGLEPYRVYQRDANGVSDLKFSGVCAADGPVEARLRAGRRTVAGFDWTKVGEATGGAFSAVLENVPTGGEYTVEVRRRDPLGNVAAHTEVANILVGDIWILAGQSNMEGVGNLTDVAEPHPLIHCYTMGHRWELAKEPLHWLIDSPDPVHYGSRGGIAKAKNEQERREVRARRRVARTKGAGLGLPFAKELVRRTGVPVGLIASAHGGTSMKQWDPAGRDRGGETLYGSLTKQLKNAGGQARGALWYQGESDANPAAVPEFAERFQGLVEALRRDVGNPDLPFYYVQIGRFVRDADSEYWDRIQELQRQAEEKVQGVALISVIDLELDDLIHVGTQGLKRAGKRLAKIAHRELFGAEHLERGPRPASAKAGADRRTVRVRFSGVNRRLFPGENVKGFSVHGKDGKRITTIYDAYVDPGSPDTVVVELQNPLPDGAALCYGKGLDPVCNLVDAEDMAAPAFGPLKIEP